MKIKEIVKVNSLESHYVSQKIDGLINSIEKGGLKEPVVINLLNELIHGYNRVAACEQLGYTDIEVVIEDVESSLFEYTTRNIHRTKTTEDLIKDIEVVLEKFPRKQGKRHTGTPYVRHEEIIKGLNYKYKDEETIRHLEFVMNNDFVGKNLMKSHLNNNEALSACVEFIKTIRKIDLDNNYGFTKKVLDGTMLVKDANKLIQM